MKEIKRFLRKNRNLILTYGILALTLAILGLTVILLFSEGMNAGPIFFLVAMLMVALALQYGTRKRPSKGVLIFYYLAAVASVVVGVLLYVIPTPVV